MIEQLNEVKRIQKIAGINNISENTTNVVDTIPEIQRYLKDLSINIPKITGIDTAEVKNIVELLNTIIEKLGSGAIGPSLKVATDVLVKRTQGLKNKKP